MIKEKLCGLLASTKGFKKTDILDNVVVENTECLIDSFLKTRTKVCSGICGKCRKKVTKGIFSKLSRGSLTENSELDPWHL